jgi:cobalt-zinc-cadmium efflux system outer membrane protein
MLGGCASVSQQGEALRALSAHTGVRIESYAAQPPQEVADTLRILLEKPLTADAAVQVAVLNSPRFQALLQELSMARADQRQGRLLPNPALELALRGEGFGGNDFEYTLLEDLKGLLIYPLSRGLANSQYAQARMRLAGDLLEEIEKVKVAYFELQGLLQTRSLLSSILQSIEASAELAARQRRAGTINALEEVMRQTILREARLEMARLEASVQTARLTLGQLLGLSADDWQIAASLPSLPEGELELSEIERLSLGRPDLEAARKGVQVAQQALQLARFSAVPSLQVGANFKKEEKRRTAGPAVALELPLFDWGQAGRARARAQKAQAQHRLRALEEEARSQVRSRFVHMELARQSAQHYRDSLIPLRAQAVAEAQKHYNYMLLGVYQLLQVRQEEVAARRQYVAALADYWIARAHLERAVGAPLPPGKQSLPESGPAEEQEKSPPTPIRPHHH